MLLCACSRARGTQLAGLLWSDDRVVLCCRRTLVGTGCLVAQERLAKKTYFVTNIYSLLPGIGEISS